MGTKTIFAEKLDVPVIKLDSRDSKTACGGNAYRNMPFLFDNHLGMLAELPKVTGFKFKIQKKSPGAGELVKGIKKWHCSNCHRESITSDKIKVYLCGCGEYMREM